MVLKDNQKYVQNDFLKDILRENEGIDELKMNVLTQSIRDLNEFIRNDKRVDISMLPIADGVTFCYKK